MSSGTSAIATNTTTAGVGRPAVWFAAVASVLAGCAALAARAIPDPTVEVGYGLVVAGILLAVTLVLKRSASRRDSWELAFVLFVFAVVQVLNNSLPAFVQSNILHDQPVAGDPLASTVLGTVVIQLFETLIAVVPIVVLARLAGLSMGSLYVRVGRSGRIRVAAFVVFALVYLVIGLSPAAHRFLPVNGAITLDRYLGLTPALLVMVLSNGLQEELLFRGLFLQRFVAFFGLPAAYLAQAFIFSFAHAGVTYTPSALLFIVVAVFPLGLLGAFLMRRSDGLLAPAIVHAALDIPIYLAFLTFAS